MHRDNEQAQPGIEVEKIIKKIVIFTKNSNLKSGIIKKHTDFEINTLLVEFIRVYI